MKNYLTLIALFAAIGFSANSLAAPVTWTVSGLTFDDGGTLIGSFDFDADTDTYTNINLITTGGSILPGEPYSVASIINPINEREVTLNDAPWQFDSLRLGFGTPAAGLTNAGGTLTLYANESSGDLVQFRSGTGTISAVPVPAAVWLFASALAGLGWLGRKLQAA